MYLYVVVSSPDTRSFPRTGTSECLGTRLPLCVSRYMLSHLLSRLDALLVVHERFDSSLLYRIRTYFRELLEMHSGIFFADFSFRCSGRSNLQFFYLAHTLCSCTRQYECEDRSDSGSETVPGQFFASINLHGLGFIHEYSENLYTTKISTYTV